MACNLFWGSHGCDLELDHEDFHTCTIDEHNPCCQFDTTNSNIRWADYPEDDDYYEHWLDTWSEWTPYGRNGFRYLTGVGFTDIV